MGKNPRPLPEFKSEAEERAYWDASDSTANIDWSKAERARMPNLKSTTTYDAAENLKSIESQTELLTDALESGDAGYIANALGVIARARGMTETARGAGVERESPYETLCSDGEFKMTTFLEVIKSLGFKLSAQPAQLP